MKSLYSFLILALISTAKAQSFNTGNDTRHSNFKECQQNQILIYNSAIEQTRNQLRILGDEIEPLILADKMSPEKSVAYRNIFLHLVTKKAMLEKLRLQMKSSDLNKFIQSEHQRLEKLPQRHPEKYFRPFMNHEAITTELERDLKSEMQHLSLGRSSLVADYFKVTVTWQFSKTVITHTFRLFVQVGSGLFAHISLNAMRSIVLNIGSSLFINALKGSLITLAMDPFLGARLPPETEWTDLLKKYPELILYPEWMTKAHVGDGFPWQTHCSAIARRTSYMEDRWELYLRKDQKDFENRLTFASNLVDFKKLNEEHLRPAVDNTRVIRPLLNSP